MPAHPAGPPAPTAPRAVPTPAHPRQGDDLPASHRGRRAGRGGDWEGDLIVGKANQSYVGTLVERTTRLVVLLHLPNGPSDDQVIAALAAKLGRLPTELCRSLDLGPGHRDGQPHPLHS